MVVIDIVGDIQALPKLGNCCKYWMALVTGNRVIFQKMSIQGYTGVGNGQGQKEVAGDRYGRVPRQQQAT